MDMKARIWLHNPLHDYESIWWIAVWFLFTSNPEGVDENDMRNTHSAVFGDHFLEAGSGMPAYYCQRYFTLFGGFWN